MLFFLWELAVVSLIFPLSSFDQKERRRWEFFLFSRMHVYWLFCLNFFFSMLFIWQKKRKLIIFGRLTHVRCYLDTTIHSLFDMIIMISKEWQGDMSWASTLLLADHDHYDRHHRHETWLYQDYDFGVTFIIYLFLCVCDINNDRETIFLNFINCQKNVYECSFFYLENTSLLIPNVDNNIHCIFLSCCPCRIGEITGVEIILMKMKNIPWYVSPLRRVSPSSLLLLWYLIIIFYRFVDIASIVHCVVVSINKDNVSIHWLHQNIIISGCVYLSYLLNRV